MDDFLTSSSMDKHNEQLLAGLSAPVAPAKKPAMMAPPMAPPPPQPYGMMAPPPQQPYGYGAPPPQPYGMPAAPAPVWPPAGASQVPQAGPTYTSYQKPTAPPPAAPADPRARPTEADFSKVRSTLHSCVRDWAAEGAAERAACYGPILDELERVVPRDGRSRVLVPGAGLARLVLEVAARGYGAQGNEFSYHMLLCSNFLLNSGLRPNEVALYPFVDQPSNCRRAGDRLRAARVPDVVPAALLRGGGGGEPDFSMAAGEFLDVYRDQREAWDAVAACFFVDTAPVALEYVAAIWRLLKPGGAWVNLGPLLYHWVPTSGADLEGGLDARGRPTAGADDRYLRALEFSWDELRHAILAQGFELVREEWRHCTYTANARSMMRTDYDCIFFTARKPAAEGKS